MKVIDLPLPSNLKDLILSKGFEELYPPQLEAIKTNVLDGENLLLTTPTASGKTLIAFMTAAKTIIEKGGKVVYLTPLRALAQEKYEEFKSLEKLTNYEKRKIKVFISTGDYDSPSDYLKWGDIIVLTNEKFDSLLRHNIKWIEDIKLVIVDEVHLVGDIYRGPTLEIILTKIKFFMPNAQLITLSATISNSNEIKKWLRSKLVIEEWRPIKLIEGVYIYGEIIFSDNSKKKIEITNRGIIIDIAIDTVKDGDQSIIFAETRRRSVSLANKISELVPSYLSSEEKMLTTELARKILSTSELTDLSRKLASLIEKGTAFHHAGLDNQHRKIVEEGFKNRIIKTLVATPTLAAGVNLPARRVVLSSLYRYDAEYGSKLPISILDYKQMCGRAGRPKFDTIGEAVIIAQNIEDADYIYSTYIKGIPEKITSQISRLGVLRTHLLAIISTLPGLSIDEIKSFFSNTLFAEQDNIGDLEPRLQKSLDFLISEMLVEKRGKRLISTDFGRRISMLYIDPLTGILFRDALKYEERINSKSVGLLHLISSTPDFTPKLFLRKSDWESSEFFFENHKDEFMLPIPEKNNFNEYEFFISNFRIVMALLAWIEEYSEEKIMKLYSIEPGDLYRAVENSDWLLYSLSEVCRIFRKPFYLNMIDQLRKRVKYGVKRELIPLTALTGVGRKRARSLYISGYRDISELKKAKVEELAKVEKIGLALAKRIKKQLE